MRIAALSRIHMNRLNISEANIFLCCMFSPFGKDLFFQIIETIFQPPDTELEKTLDVLIRIVSSVYFISYPCGNINHLKCLRCEINRGSYMSVHVLLNLLNELGKRDKMRGLPSILSLFRNEFKKFNNTSARMLDSIYHMTLRLLWNLISGIKRYNFVIMYATLLWTS